MSKEILKFDEVEVKKSKLNFSKSPIFIEDVDVNKILISEDFLYEKIGEKWKEKRLQVFHWLQK